MNDQVRSYANPVSTEGITPTYSYGINNFTPAAAATDVLTISGVAGKLIKINYIQITADATSASVFDFYAFRRSAANTGGTATNPTPVPHDPRDPPASAVLSLYSANPTGLGAVVGTNGIVRSDHYALPAAATTGYPGAPWFEEFGKRNDKAIILTKATDLLCIGFDGQTLPAGFTAHIAICWTEERYVAPVALPGIV